MTEIRTGRPATLAPNGMVTSPHSLASAAGVDVLRAGGSAVDAALATSAALSVLYPHMTGIGGDAFWLIHDAKTNKVRYIDGGGRATSGGTIDAFTKRGLTEVPYRGVLPGTLTVPGAVASWTEAHAAYGRLPLKRCLDSAIGYARDGFPVTARLATWRNVARPELEKSPEAAAIFLPHGPVLKNPNLARTLEAIASDGWYGFYDGEVAKELVRWSQANDGFFTAGRSQGAAGALGRADRRHLSRRDDLRDTAADPGLRGARDAEPARAARPAQQAVPRPRLRPSHGPGQAARLSRPRPPHRRPALQPTCRSSA